MRYKRKTLNGTLLPVNYQWRFSYHYYKKYNMMSVHFKGKCYKTQEVVCWCPVETKYNKRQPKIVMQGYCSGIEFKDNCNIIIIK